MGGMKIINLTRKEVFWGYCVEAERRCRQVLRGRGDANGLAGTYPQHAKIGEGVQGALGELAVSKSLV